MADADFCFCPAQADADCRGIEKRFWRAGGAMLR